MTTWSNSMDGSGPVQLGLVSPSLSGVARGWPGGPGGGCGRVIFDGGPFDGLGMGSS